MTEDPFTESCLRVELEVARADNARLRDDLSVATRTHQLVALENHKLTMQRMTLTQRVEALLKRLGYRSDCSCNKCLAIRAVKEELAHVD
jgi:FtsZ-binding cell division protein ZapB